MIEYIHLAGGDIIKFAGDAMQVVWRVPETPQPPQSQPPQHGGGASSSSSSAENGSTSSQAAAFTSSSSSLPTVVEGSRESASSARDSYRTQPASPRTPAAASSQGFPTDGAGSSSSSTIGAEDNYCPPGLGEQVLEAARCCLRMLTDLHGFSPVSGVTLKLHIGIGAGRMTAYTVGGHMKKWYA